MNGDGWCQNYKNNCGDRESFTTSRTIIRIYYLFDKYKVFYYKAHKKISRLHITEELLNRTSTE